MSGVAAISSGKCRFTAATCVYSVSTTDCDVPCSVASSLSRRRRRWEDDYTGLSHPRVPPPPSRSFCAPSSVDELPTWSLSSPVMG